MIISRITGGIGNQLYQYAAGRRLAQKWNTELKIDKSYYDKYNLCQYVLQNAFNIKAGFATTEEIEHLKSFNQDTEIGDEKNVLFFHPEILEWPDNVYLQGCFEDERYFADITDIIRNEFTFIQSFGMVAQHWKEKILATECSVSVHFRHGDNIYSPRWNKNPFLTPLPFEYYYECIRRLKQQYKNLTLFVFSNNLKWVKENFRVDVPMEFVEGCEADVEELYLMSICQHNIIANSTFSWWGAWLNQNNDKKVFVPIPSLILGTKETYRHFSAERNENSKLDSDRWIRIPFDLNKRPSITMPPIFSILLVVNDDIATIGETLGSILGQDYKFFELIIIDNASTDGSNKICRQAAKEHNNVTLIKLWKRISNGDAWNKSLDIAQGKFVLFLKGNDRLLSNALTSICLINEEALVDVVSSVVRLKESDGGNIDLAGRKFVAETDAAFQGLQGTIRAKFDKATLFKIFASNGGSTPLATKIFKRKFLMDNNIRFDEKSDDAEILFVMNAMFQAEENIFVPHVFYVAPRK